MKTITCHAGQHQFVNGHCRLCGEPHEYLPGTGGEELTIEEEAMINAALAEEVRRCRELAAKTADGPLDSHFYWRGQEAAAVLLTHKIKANGLAFTNGKSAFA